MILWVFVLLGLLAKTTKGTCVSNKKIEDHVKTCGAKHIDECKERALPDIPLGGVLAAKKVTILEIKHEVKCERSNEDWKFSAILTLGLGCDIASPAKFAVHVKATLKMGIGVDKKSGSKCVTWGILGDSLNIKATLTNTVTFVGSILDIGLKITEMFTTSCGNHIKETVTKAIHDLIEELNSNALQSTNPFTFGGKKCRYETNDIKYTDGGIELVQSLVSGSETIPFGGSGDGFWNPGESGFSWSSEYLSKLLAWFEFSGRRAISKKYLQGLEIFPGVTGPLHVDVKKGSPPDCKITESGVTSTYTFSVSIHNEKGVLLMELETMCIYHIRLVEKHGLYYIIFSHFEIVSTTLKSGGDNCGCKDPVSRVGNLIRELISSSFGDMRCEYKKNGVPNPSPFHKTSQAENDTEYDSDGKECSCQAGHAKCSNSPFV